MTGKDLLNAMNQLEDEMLEQGLQKSHRYITVNSNLPKLH